MKKWIVLSLTLALTAALLSGCMLPELLECLTASNNRTYEVEESEEPMDDGLYAYEPSVSYEVESYAMGNALAPSAKMASTGYYDDYADFNTEEYAAVQENGFRKVATDPLSTFSADVDTASYCNLRRMLNDDWYAGEIPSGAVRVEEMLNYFRYDYAAPTGDARFGVTAQIADCPWNPANKLLMLGVRAADAPRISDDGSNLVFLMDVSGSMDYENKLELAKKAMAMLVDELTEKDTVSIVTYASGEDIIIEGANPVKDKAKLLTAIDSLYASGSTNGQ